MCAFALVVMAAVGCGPNAEEPTPQLLNPAEVVVEPMCKAGCVDPDPNPAAPGLHLGFAVVPSECFYGEQTDRDQDGMGDYCEERLAEAFAPLLRHYETDDVRRQSYWAARMLDNNRARIAYAIGYYVDLGVAPSTIGCEVVSIGEIFADCDGHGGDSEMIALDVRWDPATQHWLLDEARYSFHGGYSTYRRGSNAYPTQLTYPQHPAAHPTAWVAYGKHANYRNQSECDAGNGGGDIVNWVFSFDSCEGNNAFFRFDAYGNHNLGSDDHRLLNCIETTDPVYLSLNPRPAPECFWSAQHFFGWQLYPWGQPPASYGDQLRDLGF